MRLQIHAVAVSTLCSPPSCSLQTARTSQMPAVRRCRMGCSNAGSGSRTLVAGASPRPALRCTAVLVGQQTR
ncbi:hypothetical protein HaLaN_21487 [Haematococcus lacustris]|uniref:Uncharacterized protein n=1 Tax=Haematococcus lacustris TaxID=44745 RepID=A0A699ZYH9_HAELA|nr:hypothetical protein HaLaN_21487 [Haematococcus lacustris]